MVDILLIYFCAYALSTVLISLSWNQNFGFYSWPSIDWMILLDQMAESEKKSLHCVVMTLYFILLWFSVLVCVLYESPHFVCMSFDGFVCARLCLYLCAFINYGMPVYVCVYARLFQVHFTVKYFWSHQLYTI